ncbi:YfcE family phosphodiesterase [Aggregatilineales bacterium SYSU G02658]
MRIGIISDTHGDIETLENTLNKLYNEHQVSAILSAGDLVGRGPEQNRVVEVHRQHGFITVRGNHDEFFNGITKENAAFLKSLPVDWRGELGGRRLFMCHGKPGNNMWGMYRDHLSDTYLNMVLKSLQADVLITGHTHVPLYVRVQAGCVLNPGSLYAFDSTRATSHTYGVLDLTDLSFDVFDSRVGEAVTPLSWKVS